MIHFQAEIIPLWVINCQFHIRPLSRIGREEGPRRKGGWGKERERVGMEGGNAKAGIDKERTSCDHDVHTKYLTFPFP